MGVETDFSRLEEVMLDTTSSIAVNVVKHMRLLLVMSVPLLCKGYDADARLRVGLGLCAVGRPYPSALSI